MNWMNWRCCRGQALVETIIVLPLVFLVVMSMVQVGLLLRTKILMEMAVRMGVRLVAAGRDAEKHMRDFLEANSVVRGLEYDIKADRSLLYTDEVVVECSFPVFGVFRSVVGPSVHLKSHLSAHGGGLSFLDWLSSM
jgi:hypothetical protein